MPGLLADRILEALPQTQCTRCGYPDCARYAQAIADGLAPINQCPPGGAQGIVRLAAITGQPPAPLNPDNGIESPRSVAFVDEAWCIGCTLCIKACPTDAIVGSHKRMHTVLEAYCTGCELCIPVCPVDCIVLENASGEATGWNAWSDDLAEQSRQRYAASRLRCHSVLIPDEPAAADPSQAPGGGAQPAGLSEAVTPVATPAAPLDMRAVIASAQAKARALRQR